VRSEDLAIRSREELLSMDGRILVVDEKNAHGLMRERPRGLSV
jgi:hypothetical protein